MKRTGSNSIVQRLITHNNSSHTSSLTKTTRQYFFTRNCVFNYALSNKPNLIVPNKLLFYPTTTTFGQIRSYTTTNWWREKEASTNDSDGTNTSAASSSEPITLNLMDYESWNAQQVASVLTSPKSLGDAGLSFEKVKPLYEAGFDGSSLHNIVENIMKKDEYFALDRLDRVYNKNNIPQLSDTCQTIVSWVASQLLPNLYSLWTRDQVKEKLCLPKIQGGAGLTSKQMTDLYDVNPGIDGAFLYSMAQAKGESVIDCLGNNDVSKEVVKWINLIHNRTLVVQLRRLDDISLLFNKYAPRETPNPLVMSIVNIPFKTNDQFVANVSYCFEQLLVARDKQSISIPFLACGPGTGKSRTLQEIFPLTKPGQQFKDNSIILLTSFGNGFAIDPETEPLSYEKALCLRILYSYLKVNEFRAFREENKNINCTLSTVLQAITHHFKTTNNKMNEKVYIYLGIDEFTELKRFEYEKVDAVSKEVQKKTFLHRVITLLGNFIQNYNTGSNFSLLPMFGGLDYNAFSVASGHSQYGTSYFTPYLFTSEDIYSITKEHLPSPIISSTSLWKYLACVNGHARTLEWFLAELKRIDLSYPKSPQAINDEIMKCYNRAKEQFAQRNKHVTFNKEVAKKILAYVITEQTFPSFTNEIIPGGPTFKALEDGGYIRLRKHSEKDYWTCTSSLPMLEKCYEGLESKSIFNDLFKYLLETPKTVDRDFEVFNSLYDLVLSQCYSFLGRKEMTVFERFKGVKIVNGNFGNLTFNIDSFPTQIVQKKLKDVQKEGIPTKTLVQFERHNTAFFDRCYNASLSNGEVYTLLWQEKGSHTSYRKFTSKNLNDISKHYSAENITSLHSTLDKSIGFIITTRPISSLKVSNIRNNIAIIGREQLEKYYGRFIFKIYFCHNIIIPFPVNQTFTDPNDIKRYMYNLGFLLGSDDRKAETLHNQIVAGKVVKNMEDLKDVKNPNLELSSDLFNFAQPNFKKE